MKSARAKKEQGKERYSQPGERRADRVSRGKTRPREGEVLTSWRAESRRSQQGQKKSKGRRGTHVLESREQTKSARAKKEQGKERYSRPGAQRADGVSRGKTRARKGEVLTTWRAESRQSQQGQKKSKGRRGTHKLESGEQTESAGATKEQGKERYSRPGERRADRVSRGKKRAREGEVLTFWRAESRQSQQGQKKSKGRRGTHGLESRGQAESAGAKKEQGKERYSPTGERRAGRVSRGKKRAREGEVLTNWRAESRQSQQGQKKSKGRRGTHVLESGEQAESAGAKKEQGKERYSHPGEQRADRVSRGKKRAREGEVLTNWRAESRQSQQGQKKSKGRRGTHQLESGEQTESAGAKKEQGKERYSHSGERRADRVSRGKKRAREGEVLTDWRAEDRQSQQGQKKSKGRRGTHELESGEQTESAGAKKERRKESHTRTEGRRASWPSRRK